MCWGICDVDPSDNIGVVVLVLLFNVMNTAVEIRQFCSVVLPEIKEPEVVDVKPETKEHR
eukprot:UN08050